MNANYAILLCTVLLLCSCSKAGGDDAEGKGGTPTEARLVFPDNNRECTEGILVNNAESTIGFQWEASENTDSYELNIRNITSNTTMQTESQTNGATVTLERGAGYEWFVVSKNADATATSEKWKFYNQGDGEQNYAPFPAEAVSPTRGKTLDTGGNISLQWSATDVDNDIVTYEVFFDTATNPTTSLGTVQQSSLSVTVITGQTYYWVVKVTDIAGNSSRSEVFDFRVR